MTGTAAERRFYRNLGARVRTARLAAGLSQQQLADHTGIVRSSIANLEAGRQHPPAHTLALIVDACHVTANDLITGPDMWEAAAEFFNLDQPLADTDEGTRDFVTAALASLDGPAGTAP